MNNITIFKEIFEDDLVWLDECNTVDDLYDLAECMFTKDYNYNNCDITSGMCCFRLDEIVENLKELKNETK